jgi:hypothetical protein
MYVGENSSRARTATRQTVKEKAMARDGSVRVKIRANGPVEGSARRAVFHKAERLARRIKDDMDRLTQDNGDLSAQNYAYVDRSTGIIHVGNRHKAARFVHNGTAPHVINARPGGTLAWKAADGSQRFAKSVFHPGTRANPFMKDALALNRGEVR